MCEIIDSIGVCLSGSAVCSPWFTVLVSPEVRLLICLKRKLTIEVALQLCRPGIWSKTTRVFRTF